MLPTIDAFAMDPDTVPSHDHLRKFQFIREIASGGFGSVFLTKVMHADGFSRLVAVKLLKSQWSDSDEVARRMRDEARLLGLLRHRNIVDVIDLTSIDGRAAVIMEYLEAVDLRTVVLALAEKEERIPARAALEAVASVASALDAAYNRPPIPGDKPLRVIHRDIKPSNIMVDETGMVKVLDFGVARSEIDNRESHTQELQFGSVDYMAPERLFFEPETPASDVYSLAATLFEILALEKFGKARGRPARHAAYVADRLSFLRAGLGGVSSPVASELEKLIGQGLEFNHEDRPTAAEFYQRARALARKVESDDLSAWSEQAIPPMVTQSQEAASGANPLSGQTLSEDSRAFAPGEHDPESQSAGAADVLRQGAMAEMEDTGAFVPSPQTGAPAQLHGRNGYEPDPEEAWDDGPTAVGGLKGPVRVPRADSSEEARMVQNGSQAQTPAVPADPGDPFAQLVRSPLSPPKTPKPRPGVPAGEDEGETQVAAEPGRPGVPGGRPSTGYFDPAAPVASEPVPPLPTPPGIEPRPLEPVLPAAAEAAGETVPPVVPEQATTPVATEADPNGLEEDVPTRPSAVVGPPAAVFDDQDGTNLMVAQQGAGVRTLASPASLQSSALAGAAASLSGETAPGTPGGMATEAGVPAPMAPESIGSEASAPPPPQLPGLAATPGNDTPASEPTQPAVSPVVKPPAAVFDASDATNLMYVQAGTSGPTNLASAASAAADGAPVGDSEAGSFDAEPPQPAAPEAVVAEASTPPPRVEQDTAADAAQLPSLDDVVPSSPDSRYGPELERARVHDVQAGAAPVPVIPAYEPTHDSVSVEPAGAAVPAAAEAAHPEIASAPADAEPAPPRKSQLPILAAAGCLSFVLLGGGGLGAAYALGLVGTPASPDAVAEAPAAPAEPVKVAADTGSNAGAGSDGPPAGMMQVRSAADDTRKLSVTCAGDVKESGEVSVLIPGDTTGPCRVKVILESRKRLTASVETPAAGAWLCFADGADECVPQ